MWLWNEFGKSILTVSCTVIAVVHRDVGPLILNHQNLIVIILKLIGLMNPIRES